MSCYLGQLLWFLPTFLCESHSYGIAIKLRLQVQTDRSAILTNAL